MTGDNILWVVGAGATIATLIFQFSFYLGKITQKLDGLTKTVEEHDQEIKSLHNHNRRSSDRPIWNPESGPL
jgi:hypothetical protein